MWGKIGLAYKNIFKDSYITEEKGLNFFKVNQSNTDWRQISLFCAYIVNLCELNYFVIFFFVTLNMTFVSSVLLWQCNHFFRTKHNIYYLREDKAELGWSARMTYCHNVKSLFVWTFSNQKSDSGCRKITQPTNTTGYESFYAYHLRVFIGRWLWID